ncbi:MAG TPA: HAD family phosphatase [Solirubrobacteraceae bacterium]|jgi:HAD superfamily hydrolase (TIGR01509 family)|nr:HAD family phosphatase [Solirubrobacteraceae bacterium]
MSDASRRLSYRALRTQAARLVHQPRIQSRRRGADSPGHQKSPPDLSLVIFDCDGVLVDSEVISNGVLADMLSAEGLPTMLAEARRDYQGMLLSDVQSKAEQKLGRPLPDDWLSRYEQTRAAAFRAGLKPVADAPEAVQRCLDSGLAVCVASQGKLSKTSLSLSLTGLDHLFPEHTRFSAHTVARGKPWPDLFLHAAQRMSADPGQCVVVEDTPSGVLAGVSAGMRVIGYAADSDRNALREAGAQQLLDSLEQIPGVLGVS